MTLAAKRRSASRSILLDRALEELPLFRLSDTADDSAISYTNAEGGRWRVFAQPWRSTSRHVRPGRVRRADASLPGGRRTTGRRAVVHAPFVPAIDRPACRRTYVRAASVVAHPTRAHGAAIGARLFRRCRRGDGRYSVHTPELGHDRAAPIYRTRSARSVSRHGRRRARRGARGHLADRATEPAGTSCRPARA